MKTLLLMKCKDSSENSRKPNGEVYQIKSIMYTSDMLIKLVTLIFTRDTQPRLVGPTNTFWTRCNRKNSKPSLFTADMIIYLGESKESTEKINNHPSKTNQFNGRLYNIYQNPTAFLYVGKKHNIACNIFLGKIHLFIIHQVIKCLETDYTEKWEKYKHKIH